MESVNAKRKQVIGKVVSTKMDKTIVVQIESKIMHPLYKKYVKSSKRVKGHDALNKCTEGDTVQLEETRPLSKEKRYKLVEIIEKVK